jgi:elongation factor P hydroxylase
VIDAAALRIAEVFNATFAGSHRTVLQLGGVEPLYLPATADRCARVVSNQDFPASALHEAAHWCLASKGRRTQIDYGYWYCPPPRSRETQAEFLRMEERNQALESLFAEAARLDFRVSLDDVGVDPDLARRFAARVHERAQQYAREGLPLRAERFRRALHGEFGRG